MTTVDTATAQALSLLEQILGGDARPQRCAPMTGQASPKYLTEQRALTADDLAAHLEGRATFASPLIGTDDQARALVIERDSGSIEDALTVLAACRRLGIRAFSIVCPGSDGHDGSHTFAVYRQPQDPVRLREQSRRILDAAQMPHAEIYPSRANIRLPFGMHRVTRTRGTLLLQNGQRFDLDHPDELAAGIAAIIKGLGDQREPPEAPPPPPPSRVSSGVDRAKLNGELSVIDAYNSVADIRWLLLARGYAEPRGYGKRDGRLCRPGRDTPSITIQDNRSFHHSSNDPLDSRAEGDPGYWRTPFHVRLTLDFSGAIPRAVREIADELGLAYLRREPSPPLVAREGKVYCPACGAAVGKSQYGGIFCSCRTPAHAWTEAEHAAAISAEHAAAEATAKTSIELLLGAITTAEDTPAVQAALLALADSAKALDKVQLLAITDAAKARGVPSGWLREWKCAVGDRAKKTRQAGVPTPETQPAAIPSPAPVAFSQQVLNLLTTFGYHFRLNDCTDDVEINGKRLDDPMRDHILVQLYDAKITQVEAAQRVWVAEALRNRYHPVKDYLNRLKWDGRDHMSALAQCLTSDDKPITYPTGFTAPLHAVYLLRWMIGAVAKVLEQAQNLALVFDGPQDLGKSAVARWLCSGLPDYFIEAPIRPDDKDADVRLMSHLVWEISELDSTTRRADVSALKAFLTKQTVTVRKAYGRIDTVKPALASFIGTVNGAPGFLADPTGNRRFLVTTLKAIDWRYTDLDVNQLWAQAVQLYRDGEPWHPLPVEQEGQRETNKQHEVDSVLEGWLHRYFILGAEPPAAMSAAEIVDHLRTAHNIRLSGSDRAQAMEISTTMERLGVQRRRLVRGGPFKYLGVIPK